MPVRYLWTGEADAFIQMLLAQPKIKIEIHTKPHRSKPIRESFIN